MSHRTPEEIRSDIVLFGKAIAAGTAGLLLYIILTGAVLAPYMEDFSETQGYPIAVTILSAIFLALIVYRIRSWEQWQHRYLPLVALCFVGFNFFQIFDWTVANVHTPFQRPEGVPLLYIADLFIPLITLLLYAHFVRAREEEHSPVIAATLALLVFPYFPISLLALTGDGTAVAVLSELLVFFAIAALIVTMYAIRVVFDLFIIARHRRAKLSALTTMVGLLYMVFAFVSQILTPDSINFGLFRASIFQLLLFALAIILILITYIIDPTFVNATTSHVYELLLYDEDHEVTWAYDFDIGTQLDDELTEAKSQVVSTVRMLLEEMSGFIGEPYRLEFPRDNTMLIYTRENCHLVVLVNKLSMQHKQTLEQFFNKVMDLVLSSSELDPSAINRQVELYFPQYF